MQTAGAAPDREIGGKTGSIALRRSILKEVSRHHISIAAASAIADIIEAIRVSSLHEKPRCHFRNHRQNALGQRRW